MTYHTQARVIAALCGMAFGLSAHHGAAQSASVDDLKRGEYLAIASDCGACHTAPGGKPFAGGFAMPTPVGTIYATNITPSKQYGIGTYSEQQFADALRKGVRGDGAHLYPAMPYTAFSLISDADIRLLYGYFMKSVAAVDEPPAKKTDLPFPYNMRFSMAIWNAMFANDAPFQPDPKQSAEWNRGKYLVEGPAHCSVCHSPRGFLFQESQSQRFGGADLGAWHAPNITSDAISGIGALSVEELAQYLRNGKLHGRAQAGGDMALAVEKSFQHLSEADIRAMAVYMKSTPPVRKPGAEKSRFDFGAPATSVGLFRGDGETKSDNVYADGAQLFVGNCAACHGFEAQGVKDGYFPSLYNNSALAAGDGRNLLAAILFGVSRKGPQGWAFMPGFGGKAQDIAALSDDQIAQIANYVLKTYGDANISVSPSLVKQVRAGEGPTPLLVSLVGASKWILGFAVLALLGFAAMRMGRKNTKRAAT